MKKPKPQENNQDSPPALAAATLLDGKLLCAWSMKRITGEVMARSDGSCYWECSDGVQVEFELPNDPPSADRFRALRNPDGSVKDEYRTQQHQEDQNQQACLYEKYRQTLIRMRDRAIRQRRLSDQSFFHRARFGIARFCRRTVSKLRNRLRDILLGGQDERTNP